MSRDLAVAAGYLAQYLKARMEYKLDFLAQAAAALATQGLGYVFILLLFQRISEFNGWSLDEMAFIYGFSLVPLGLFNAFFFNLFQVGNRYVVQGEFDRVLLRPVGTLLQVILETVHPEELGTTLTGAILAAYTLRRLGAGLDWPEVALLAVLGISATFVYAGVFTVLAASSFWFEDRVGLYPPFVNMIAFGRYPMDAFPLLLRFILTWVLPFGFAGFYPASAFLRRPGPGGIALLTPAVAAVVTAVALLVWRAGVRRYQSTGS